jgi:bifunctional DNA-binding transcriptional regulator/antitoxin component of YhaV-PrlF toxin-antitoxin module
MNATSIRERRQTTLPQSVCEAASIGPGDVVEWRFEHGEIRGRKLEPTRPLIVGVKDVPPGGILPRSLKIGPDDFAGIASAVRNERDGD